MSGILDREYQNLVLKTLAESFPYSLSTNDFNKLVQSAKNEKQFYATLIYLDDHDLIDCGLQQGIDEHFSMNLGGFKITHKGLDFISDDGGLSAILGVVTVKLDADTIRSLIEIRVNESDIPDKDKSKIKKFLASAGDKTLSHLTKRLVDYSLSQGKEVIDLLLEQIGS